MKNEMENVITPKNTCGKTPILSSYSWEIISSNIAIKHLDKSAFLHNGTGVPKEIRNYFNVGRISAGEKLEIHLFFNKSLFVAHIEMTTNKRTRIIWSSSFAKVVRGIYPEIYEEYKNGVEFHEEEKPCLFFEKINDNKYVIKFSPIVSLRQIEKDIESELAEEKEAIEFYGKRYERNAKNRKRAIEVHGLNCIVCGFNFEKVYGERGKEFIEVHHVKPISSVKDEADINPETDLVPVCSNCHRMIHRRKDAVLTIEKMKNLLLIKL